MRSSFIVIGATGLLLAACSSPPPPTQVIVQPSPAGVVAASPTAPPPPMHEIVPPPPASTKPVIWQPGHWRYTGISPNPWSWESGQYVAVPSGATAWVPGSWSRQGSGWVWEQGHWA